MMSFSMPNDERVPHLHVDNWASVVGKVVEVVWRITYSPIACCCSVNLAYFALSTASLLLQAKVCRQFHWGLEGRSKAGNTVTNTIACSPLPLVRIPVQDFIFFLSRGFIQSIHHTKISHYTARGHRSLFCRRNPPFCLDLWTNNQPWRHNDVCVVYGGIRSRTK